MHIFIQQTIHRICCVVLYEFAFQAVYNTFSILSFFPHLRFKMKLISFCIVNIITFTISATSKQEDNNNSTAVDIWQDGKVPYEISNQFGKKNQKHRQKICLQS